MRPDQIVVASKNPDKVKEVEEVLAVMDHPPQIVHGLEWPDVAETEDTLEGNALLKARAVADATGLAALSDDTGLEVDGLGGLPGVHTSRFAGPDADYDDNVAKLLADLAAGAARTARFRTVVALVMPGRSEWVAEGVLEGRIASERRGDHGFGYDPVFELADGRTLAEVPPHEKNAISHRAQALRALVDQLDDLG